MFCLSYGSIGLKKKNIFESVTTSLLVCLFVTLYLSSLPAARLSDAPKRRLVVMGDSASIQDETIESSAWFFNVLGV